jgi:hypothetical protein
MVEMRMKKLFLLLSLCISMLALNASAQNSLADVARKARANRQTNPSARVIDNDVIPTSVKSSPSQPPPATAEKAKSPDDQKDSDKKGDATDDKKSDAKDQEKATPAELEQKKSGGLKKQIDDQKKEITQLQRELDVSEREARLRAAAYYADAGTMLRDQGKFLEDSRKQQAEIDTKKQALTDARQKLDDLQELARKAGIAVE